MAKIETFKINFSISPEDDEASDSALADISNRIATLCEADGCQEHKNFFKILFAFAQLDAVLADSKAAVLSRYDAQKETMGLVSEYMAACKGIVPPVALYEESCVPYYNTSAYSLSDCVAAASMGKFNDYAAGYSPSVQAVMRHISFDERLSSISNHKVWGQAVDEALNAGAGLSKRAKQQVASELLLATGVEDPIITCLKDMRGYTVIEQIIS